MRTVCVVSEETYAMKKKLISNECNLDEKSVVEAIEEKKISAEYATSYTGGKIVFTQFSQLQ